MKLRLIVQVCGCSTVRCGGKFKLRPSLCACKAVAERQRDQQRGEEVCECKCSHQMLEQLDNFLLHDLGSSMNIRMHRQPTLAVDMMY